jgi:hypothetical protein
MSTTSHLFKQTHNSARRRTTLSRISGTASFPLPSCNRFTLTVNNQQLKVTHATVIHIFSCYNKKQSKLHEGRLPAAGKLKFSIERILPISSMTYNFRMIPPPTPMVNKVTGGL